MKQSTLPLAKLHAALDYNKETGEFRWKLALSKKTRIGSLAGVIAQNGRRYVALYGETHLAHRLAWFYVNGEWPTGNISPKNGNHADVRFENLVMETPGDTARKSGARSTNKSGFKGVSWSSDKNKWIATITKDYKRYHLGYFDTPDQAFEKYQEAVNGNIEASGTQYDPAEISKEMKLRVLWNKTRKLYNTERVWCAFELFCEDVPQIELDSDLVPVDETKKNWARQF